MTTQDGARIWRHVLRETKNQRGQYICLSHKWDGDTETSQTTASNYMCRIGNCQENAHTQPCTSNVDWMPRLFRETCILAHDLGIKYVWIDSICIKQGEDEEWNREAPQMAQYYQNAWITVVAANQAKDNGLLNMRRKEPVPRIIRLPYMDRNGEQKGYFYLQPARPDVLQKDFSVGVERSELLQRGWVFQEWRLSRRIIAFSDSDFFLHCHTLGSASPMGDHLHGAGVRVSRGSIFDGNTIQSISLHPLDWKNIVSEYSGLGLTYLAKDRLVALAGVASEVGRTVEALNDTSNHRRRYVCGLWLNDIHKGLLWEQATPGSRERLPGIPTWSWASMASHNTDKNNQRVLTGMSVRWSRRGFFRPHEKARVWALRKITTIPVEDQNWLPQFGNRRIPDDVPEYEYGNENRFVILTIYSSLLSVQIETLLSDQDADLADEATSTPSHEWPHAPGGPDPKIIFPDHSWGMGLWRGICLLTNPGRIIGWASVEHPELQSPEEIASCSGSIYALILERCEEKGGWFRWGRLLISRVIFTVLLVRRVSIPGFDECFERVGVGRLFSEEVDKGYMSTEKTTLSLV